MAIGKLTLREAQRTDDGRPLNVAPVSRWAVDGLPNGERADIAEMGGTWRLLRVRNGALESDPREFPTAEAAFAVLVEEFAPRS